MASSEQAQIQCIFSCIRAFVNGFYSGSKIRFFHALITSSIKMKHDFFGTISLILKSTFIHALRLGFFGFFYKLLVFIFSKIINNNYKIIFFLSSIISSIPFRRHFLVNKQVIQYLLPKILIVSSKRIKQQKIKYSNLLMPMLASLICGLFMLFYEIDGSLLPKSITYGMNSIFRQSSNLV